jgi:hypothetical protein
MSGGYGAPVDYGGSYGGYGARPADALGVGPRRDESGRGSAAAAAAAARLDRYAARPGDGLTDAITTGAPAHQHAFGQVMATVAQRRRLERGQEGDLYGQQRGSPGFVDASQTDVGAVARGRKSMAEASEFAPDDDYRSDAVRGLWQRTPVSDAFFGPVNERALQDALRHEVFKRTGRVVGEQTDLRLVMRGIFLQYGRNLDGHTRSQVRALNRLVLDFAVADVTSAVVDHANFVASVDRVPEPLAWPTLDSAAGNKQLALCRFL